MTQQKQERLLLALVLGLLVVAGVAWYVGWVVPNDRKMEATFECMGGDPQRYDACADQVAERGAEKPR